MKNKYFAMATFILYDVAAAVVSMSLSFMLTGDMLYVGNAWKIQDGILLHYIIYPLILLLVFYLLKIYHILWKYFTFSDLVRTAIGTAISIAALLVIQMAISNGRFRFSFYLLTFFITLTLILIHRAIYKVSVNKKAQARKRPRYSYRDRISGNIMIIGAGEAGEMIINEMTHKKDFIDCKIKCVIDDDPYKKGQYISGVKVVGGREMIVETAKNMNINVIVFAIPNCKTSQKSEILSICQQTDCKLKVVPSICRLDNFTEIATAIRKVEIEDLLGRDPIDINLGDKMNYVKNKVVMVTGGGGSIGSELCRQIAAHSPKQLIIFDIYENNAYEIQNELVHNYPQLDLLTLIGSVRDSKRLDFVFRTYKPEIVYHAAAHKHVPLMEESPNETIKNNVFGTFKTAECADKYGVKKFVLISTDKAVNPTNIMGASKRICEMIVQTFNKRSDTDFVAVRFGNVLGSNGSVIPLFKRQIEQGGPVTVTDPNIIRYFMTIPEAVSLVLQAGANAKGGEIFVLDMGKPVKILTLAENLIRLSGFTPYKDIQIKFTGLRPGEKLYEELLMSEEGLTATENNLIHIGKPIDIDEELLIDTLNEMHSVMYDESADVRGLVKRIVTTYKPEKNS
ncbi:MAG: nucleoside-diphosphate sugar epimerase/dehydratase [Acutalibacteraceae bacterium]|nr:nucleoside-diphosphate sugar epimerase/dehydratase [Acutalibacteraceae bacterium]